MSTINADGEIVDTRTMRFKRVLPGPIERVWSFLTESDKRGKWLASGNMELRIGGRAELRFNHYELSPHKEPTPEPYKKYDGSLVFTWIVTQLDPPRLLALRWGEKAEDSEVTFELEPRGNDVLLTVTHRRLPDRGFMLSISAGWQTHLDILNDYLNSRTPQPFWSTHAHFQAEYDKRIPK
jgi:uncharacterized protein YndB with AHSA1/START domain